MMALEWSAGPLIACDTRASELRAGTVPEANEWAKLHPFRHSTLAPMAMRSNDKPPEHAIGRPAHPVKHAESAAHLTSAAPVQVSVTKRYKAYYPPREVQHRVKINSLAPSTSRSAVIEPGTGRKVLSDARVEAQRQLACGFIERVGMRMGL